MNKQAFLDTLNGLVGALSDQERARLMEYYGEMIDEGVEDGIAEADVVATLGDPAEIARQLTAQPRQAPSAGPEEVTALNALRIRVSNADVAVLREPLDNGAAAQLRFSDPSRFSWRMEGDTLVVEEPESEGMLFGLRWIRQLISMQQFKLTVALSGDLPGALEFSSRGGDMLVEGLGIGGEARLRAGSGDVKLKRATFAALNVNLGSGDARLDGLKLDEDLHLKAASGDVEISGLTARAMWMESASGDMELRDCEGGELTIVSGSGDIEANRCRAGATSVHTASGDVRLEELESDPQLSVETASGDVELTRCIARETRIRSASGDVELRLEPLPCGYDLSASSASGCIELGDGCRGDAEGLKPRIAVRTASGDITAKLIH